MIIEKLDYNEYKGRKYRTEILSDRYLSIEPVGEGFDIEWVMSDEVLRMSVSDDMVSDWLYVMRYPNLSLTVNSAGAHDHGGAVASGGGHSHTIGIVDWFPNVNDKVLVLMAPGFNSDGYILGVIQ